MNLYRIKTKTVNAANIPHEFVDWYQTETEAQAISEWDKDCHQYGLPMDKTTREIAQCDPKLIRELQRRWPNNGQNKSFTP